MKKNIQINIGGSIFFIDEDAYHKLDSYLTNIKEYLSTSEEREEIIQDIEMRIAELLLEKKGTHNAIEINDIDEIIEIMGQPEEYKLEEEDTSTYTTARKPSRKLYRDTEDRFVGGVAAGLAHYVGMDPTWMRIICVLIVFAGVGSPILAYILLWFLVPEARTTSEKLQMKGKPVNFSNIEQSLKEEYNNVAQKVKDVDLKGMSNSFKKRSAGFFDWLLTVGRKLVRAFIFILGVLLFIFSFATIIGLIVFIFIPEKNLFYSGMRLGSNIYTLNNLSLSSIDFWILKTASYLSLIIPFIFLLLLSLFAINPKTKPMGRFTKTSLILVWIIAIATTVYYITSAEAATKYTGRALESVDLNLPASDTLYIKTSLHPTLSIVNSNYVIQNDSLGQHYVYGTNFNITIKETDEDEARIVIEKLAKSNTIEKANQYANNIAYHFNLEANTLNLDDYYYILNTTQNNSSRIRVYVYIPKGMVFKLDKNSARKSTGQNRRDKIVAWEFLEINDEVIECITCEEESEAIEQKTDAIDTNTEQSSEPSSDWEKKVEEAFQTN